jgi:hypothetical protein
MDKEYTVQLSGTENIWIIRDERDKAFEIEFHSGDDVVRYPIEHLPEIFYFLTKIINE